MNLINDLYMIRNFYISGTYVYFKERIFNIMASSLSVGNPLTTFVVQPFGGASTPSLLQLIGNNAW